MFKKILLSLSVIILSGCSSASLELNADDLMRPPTLSPEQTQIMDELENSLGSTNVVLKYPRYGEHLSAFVFEDITGDGNDEAIIFYEGYNNYTRIHVMEKNEDSWLSIYDAPGLQADIEFVDFVPLSTDFKNDILVGWDTSNQYDEQNIVVYSYDEGELESVFDENYSMYKLVSRKNSDSTELILLTSPQKNSSVRLIRGNSSGEMIVIGVTYLNSQVNLYHNLIEGNIDEETPALYVDEQLYDGTYSTEIISLENSRIDNLMTSGDEPNILFDYTIRYEPIFSEDIDGNGIMDIPSQTPMPGYTDEEDGIPYLTTYKNLEGRGFRSRQYNYINLDENYRVQLPEEWVDNVTVVLQPENGMVSFRVFNEDLDSSTTELLRIRTYAKNDYRDTFELEQYKELPSSGIIDYYAYIPENVDSSLAIDYEDLEDMIIFL